VVELLVGGPTATTGLVNIGDQLLSVNGHSLIGLPFEKVQSPLDTQIDKADRQTSSVHSACTIEQHCHNIHTYQLEHSSV